jgi:4-hydroxy-tetrahydrodipicolinate reductase
MPQLESIVEAGHNVVSTCEELSEPWSEHPEMAERLDRLAKKNDVSVLGTWINPGFMMDWLPVALTGACQQVNRVRVRRVVDASKRRQQLQRKIGTGVSPATFSEMAGRREIRHVGLSESASLIAKGLGWKLDSIEESIEPVVAKKLAVTDFFTVEPGFVTGVSQVARGIEAGVERIRLELTMSIDAAEASDEIWIEGTPNLRSVVKGVHGDISTIAVTCNSIRRLVDAPPGLLTMLDLPVVSPK